jgi:hypothetical protein
MMLWPFYHSTVFDVLYAGQPVGGTALILLLYARCSVPDRHAWLSPAAVHVKNIGIAAHGLRDAVAVPVLGAILRDLVR